MIVIAIEMHTKSEGDITPPPTLPLSTAHTTPLKLSFCPFKFIMSPYIISYNTYLQLTSFSFFDTLLFLLPVELAMIMDRLYGGVCYAGIDTDPELKYPKGAGRVAFSNQQSYIAAISARFVQLQHGDIDKRVSMISLYKAQRRAYIH